MIRAALLVALASSAALADPKADKLLKDVEANYKKPQHLTATFDQTVTNAITGKPAPSNGTFRVEKPDKLRFDYLQPKRADPKPKTTMIFDGKTLWVIDYPNLKVIQRSSEGDKLPSLVTFFLGAGTLSRDFTPAIAGSALELTPKQPSAAYAKIVLELDAKHMVTQTTIVDSSGNTQTMKFTSVTLDKPAPKGTFALDPKATAGFQKITP
jgi:outer membrane lipoprotein-sorting protein